MPGWMITIFLLVMVLTGFSQGFNQKYNLYLIGQLTNDVNGAPLKNHEVLIVSDTANEVGFYYMNKVFTDNDGYYYDTVLTTLEKGALVVQTTDHDNIQHDTIVHYRFRWSDNNILFANFVLPAPPLINVYQANFSWIVNPGGTNKKEVQFTDLTDNAGILCWNWDFGDGFHSQDQNPVHEFQGPGLFKVTLTVHFYTGPTSEPAISTIKKLVLIEEKSYFHMGGHVFAGYFPIDKSEVFLYKIEGDQYVPIDTAIFNDSLGYFLFYQLIEGDYILKADLHPSSALFNQFMTTYYSDKMHWDEADTIFHHSTYFEYDINLIPNNQSSAAGPGSISGEIAYDASYGGGKSTPAENVTIFLLDQDYSPVTICHSDENGQFDLDQLDLQMYYVYAEVTGKPTYPVEVELENNSNGKSTVKIVINNNYVSGAVIQGMSDNISGFGLGEVYPNPADHQVNLFYEPGDQQILECSLVNCHGQILQTSKIASSPGSATVLQIDVSKLEHGIYFIRLSDQMNRTASRKFLRK
jgi:PKD repeat protein